MHFILKCYFNFKIFVLYFLLLKFHFYSLVSLVYQSFLNRVINNDDTFEFYRCTYIENKIYIDINTYN